MIAVLGAGESGIGAALLAKKKGMEVFVSDAGNIKKLYKKKQIQKNVYKKRREIKINLIGQRIDNK